MKFNKICVLGLGYIGLPTASTFAAHGVKVLGVDVNPNIVDTLRRGDIHIHEPGLRETYKAALASGNLTVSTRPEEADAFLIAVPTPFHEDKFGEYNGQKYKLADMRAVSGRLQFRRTAQGAWLIDDSYNANPTSTLAAIEVVRAEAQIATGVDNALVREAIQSLTP